jgi:bla regulator protein BlaR1
LEDGVTSLIDLALSNLAVAAVLALVAAAVGRCCRRPAVTHALWVLVLVKLVTPPVIAIPIPRLVPAQEEERTVATRPADEHREELVLPDAPAPVGENHEVHLVLTEPEVHPKLAERWGAEKPVAEAMLPPEPPALPSTAEPPAAAPTLDWLYFLGSMWLLGSGVWLVLVARRVRQFQRLLRHARPALPQVQEETRLLAERLRVRCPEVWMVPGVLSPMMWVMGRCRRLLLPEHLLPRLTAEQRAALLAHELAHLRRGDPWVRYLELAVLAIYWWCPLVWWARSELREAEEECCDAWVIWALPGSARAYALALVETVDFMADARPALPALASGFGHVHLLRRRLTMIMRGTTPRALTTSGALVVLGMGVLLLPLLPTWAQDVRGREAADNTAQADQLKKLVDALHTELDRVTTDLKNKQAEIAALTRELNRAMDRLKGLDQSKPVPAVTTPAPKRELKVEVIPGTEVQRYATSEPRAVTPLPPPDLERRLAELERKLSLALAELHALRRELQMTR